MTDPLKSPVEQILEAVIERNRRKNSVGQLPTGITLHAIERTQTFGEKPSLQGAVLVETSDGRLHRLTGAELSEWNDALAPFLKNWHLPEE